MMHHTQIAQRVFNTPLMVDPAKALAFLTGLGPRITGREISVDGLDVAAEDRDAATLPARASLLSDDLTNRQARNGGQTFAVVDGIAVIEIAGTLVHRGAWIGQSSGLTSYEGIAAQLQAALADPTIRGIALDIDSFGGEVAGAFDLADRIRAARAQKPVHAFVADHALSAAYVLASQADRIILPRTGAVGSIGVVAMHNDMSGALDQKGIAVTLIHAGARKIDANPYQPLPEAVRARIAGELEDLRQLFAETVADGRGPRLDTQRALGTEAAVFRGEAAVFAGLADEVADPVTAFRAFAAAPRGTSTPRGKSLMMTTAPEDHAQPVAASATTPPEPATSPAVVPSQAEAEALFRFEGVSQRSVIIEQYEGVLSLLPSVPFGGPATVGTREGRSMRSFALPWIPHDDVILPADIQGQPALGVSDAADPLVEVMNRKLQLMRRKHAQTREYMEMNALRGIVKDGAGTTLYNYFTEFGLAQISVDFVLGTAGTNVQGKVREVLRAIEDNLLGETMTSVHALVSREFFDKLIAHPKTEEAYKFYAATGAQPLREDVRRNFPFAGILFEEYPGTVTLSTKASERLVPANEGIAFPLGTMDTFTTYGGPANLLETANTIGLPLYARQHLDEKGRWIDLMTEASILPVNKRPRLAIRLHSSN